MNTLAVIGMTMLGVIVGFALGVRMTARRYRNTLQHRATVIDLSGSRTRR